MSDAEQPTLSDLMTAVGRIIEGQTGLLSRMDRLEDKISQLQDEIVIVFARSEKTSEDVSVSWKDERCSDERLSAMARIVRQVQSELGEMRRRLRN